MSVTPSQLLNTLAEFAHQALNQLAPDVRRRVEVLREDGAILRIVYDLDPASAELVIVYNGEVIPVAELGFEVDSATTTAGMN